MQLAEIVIHVTRLHSLYRKFIRSSVLCVLRCVVNIAYSQDADSDIKTHQKQVDALRDVSRLLLQELAAGLWCHFPLYFIARPMYSESQVRPQVSRV